MQPPAEHAEEQFKLLTSGGDRSGAESGGGGGRSRVHEHEQRSQMAGVRRHQPEWGTSSPSSVEAEEDDGDIKVRSENATGNVPQPRGIHAHQEVPETATASTSAAPLNRPYRGKCLYQSRKCENERALKRNGKAHNLCEEHRNKQNQHQRKFDAKKFSRKRRKPVTEVDDTHLYEAYEGSQHHQTHGSSLSPPRRHDAIYMEQYRHHVQQPHLPVHVHGEAMASSHFHTQAIKPERIRSQPLYSIGTGTNAPAAVYKRSHEGVCRPLMAHARRSPSTISPGSAVGTTMTPTESVALPPPPSLLPPRLVIPPLHGQHSPPIPSAAPLPHLHDVAHDRLPSAALSGCTVTRRASPTYSQSELTAANTLADRASAEADAAPFSMMAGSVYPPSQNTRSPPCIPPQSSRQYVSPGGSVYYLRRAQDQYQLQQQHQQIPYVSPPHTLPPSQSQSTRSRTTSPIDGPPLKMPKLPSLSAATSMPMTMQATSTAPTMRFQPVSAPQPFVSGASSSSSMPRLPSILQPLRRPPYPSNSNSRSSSPDQIPNPNASYPI